MPVSSDKDAHRNHINRLVGITLTGLLLTSCASLHIRDNDSTTTKIAKGFIRIPVAAATLGMSEGWHTRERMMESWLGHHESDLMLAWGSPAQVVPDGSGGKILMYAENRMYAAPGYAVSDTSGYIHGSVAGGSLYGVGEAETVTTYVPPQTYQWQVSRNFQVNSSGVITNYSWQGL